jgi:hypothetical protein
VLTTLKRDAGGSVLETIRVEEGAYLTRVRTYQGVYNPNGTNVLLAEDTFGMGFIRSDDYRRSDGSVSSRAARRTIYYLDSERGVPLQIFRITYDTYDPAVIQPLGVTLHVYMEQYTANGATVKVQEIERDAQGNILWARRQDYDQTGNRRVMQMESRHYAGDGDPATPDEYDYMAIAAIFTDPTGSRTRVLWIPNNKDMETAGGTFPKKQIVEVANSEELIQLELWAEGSLEGIDLDTLVLSQAEWERLLAGEGITREGWNATLYLGQAAGRTEVTLNVPAPLSVRMSVQVVSYSGAVAPVVTGLNLIQLRYQNKIDEENGVPEGQRRGIAQAQLDDFKAGKTITVTLAGGQTVTLQQAALDPASLTAEQRAELLTGGAITLIQRQLVSMVGYTGEGEPPSLDQIQLSEDERNRLMRGEQVVHALADGSQVTLRLFKPADQKVVTVQSWTNPDGTPGTGEPPSLDGVTLTQGQWDELNDSADGEVTVTLGDATVTLRARSGLTTDQQDDLGAGGTAKALVLVSGGAGNGGTIEEQTLANVKTEETVTQVVSHYFASPAGIRLSVEGDTRTYTFYKPDDPATALFTVEVTLGGFAEAYRKDYQGSLRRTDTLDLGFVLKVISWSEADGTAGAGLPPSLAGVVLTPEELTRVQAGETVEMTLADGRKVMVQRFTVSLDDQQEKDLRAGRFVTVGSDTLAAVSVDDGKFYILNKRGEQVYRVEEGADGSVVVWKRDGAGWADVTSSMTQKELQAIQSARGSVSSAGGGADAAKTSAVTLDQPLMEEPLLDETDMDGDGIRNEPVRLARSLTIKMNGGDLPLVHGSRELSDLMDLTGLLERVSEGGREFSEPNGFASRFKHDPNLLPIAGIVGASATPSITGAVAVPAGAPGAAPGPAVQPPPLPPAAGAGEGQGQAFGLLALANRVYERVKGLLLDLMTRLEGAAAGALGVLTELKINEMVDRLRGAFGNFILNCGAVALGAWLKARGLLAGPDETETLAASLVVRQLLDRGAEPLLAGDTSQGPGISAYTLRRVARDLFGVGLQTIRVGAGSQELYLSILNGSGSRAIIHFPDHWVVFEGIRKDEAGRRLVQFTDSDNQSYVVEMSQFLALWKAGGGYALVEGSAAVAAVPGRTPRPLGVEGQPAPTTLTLPQPAAPKPPVPPPASAPEAPSGPLAESQVPPIGPQLPPSAEQVQVVRVGEEEEQEVSGTKPIPVLTPGLVDRVDADGTASHTDSFVEFEFDGTGKLIGAKGGSTTFGITVFGETFLTETVDKYIVIEALGQAKVSQSTATTTTHRVDGSHVEVVAVTQFSYTDGTEGPGDLPAFYKNPDGTIKAEFLNANGTVKKGLIKLTTGSSSGSGQTVFGETFTQTADQIYDIVAGSPKVISSSTSTTTTGIDGTVSDSLQILNQAYDPVTGDLTGATGSTHTDITDPFGSKTSSDVTETYAVINNQAKLILAHATSSTTGFDGAATASIYEVSYEYTDGTEDPASLPSGYSNPAPDGALPPGTVWIGLLKRAEEEEVSYVDLSGSPQTFQGTVTTTTDSFGFNTTQALIANSYQILTGQAKVVSTLT